MKYLFLLIINVGLLNFTFANGEGNPFVCNKLDSFGVSSGMVDSCKGFLSTEARLKESKESLKGDDLEMKRLKRLIKKFEDFNCKNLKTMNDAKSMPVRSCSTKINVQKYGKGNVVQCCKNIKKQNITFAKRKIKRIIQASSQLKSVADALARLTDSIGGLTRGECSNLKCISDSKDFLKTYGENKLSISTFLNDFFWDLKESPVLDSNREKDTKFNDRLNNEVITYCNNISRGLDISDEKSCVKYVDELIKRLERDSVVGSYPVDEFREKSYLKCKGDFVNPNKDVFSSLDSLDLNRIGVLRNQCKILNNEAESFKASSKIMDNISVLKDNPQALTLNNFIDSSQKYCSQLKDMFDLLDKQYFLSTEDKNKILQKVCTVEENKLIPSLGFDLTGTTIANLNSYDKLKELAKDGLLMHNKFLSQICSDNKDVLFSKTKIEVDPKIPQLAQPIESIKIDENIDKILPRGFAATIEPRDSAHIEEINRKHEIVLCYVTSNECKGSGPAPPQFNSKAKIPGNELFTIDTSMTVEGFDLSKPKVKSDFIKKMCRKALEKCPKLKDSTEVFVKLFEKGEWKDDTPQGTEIDFESYYKEYGKSDK